MSKSNMKKVVASTIFLSSFLIILVGIFPVMYTVKAFEVSGGIYNFLVTKEGWKIESFHVSSDSWRISLSVNAYKHGYSELRMEIYDADDGDEPVLTLQVSFDETTMPSLRRVSGVNERKPETLDLWRLFEKENQYYPDLPSGDYVIKIYWKNVEWTVSVEEVYSRFR